MYSDSQKSCNMLVPFDQKQKQTNEKNKLKARYFSVLLKAKCLVKLKVCNCLYLKKKTFQALEMLTNAAITAVDVLAFSFCFD